MTFISFFYLTQILEFQSLKYFVFLLYNYIWPWRNGLCLDGFFLASSGIETGERS